MFQMRPTRGHFSGAGAFLRVFDKLNRSCAAVLVDQHQEGLKSTPFLLHQEICMASLMKSPSGGGLKGSRRVQGFKGFKASWRNHGIKEGSKGRRSKVQGFSVPPGGREYAGN